MFLQTTEIWFTFSEVEFLKFWQYSMFWLGLIMFWNTGTCFGLHKKWEISWDHLNKQIQQYSAISESPRSKLQTSVTTLLCPLARRQHGWVRLDLDFSHKSYSTCFNLDRHAVQIARSNVVFIRNYITYEITQRSTPAWSHTISSYLSFG